MRENREREANRTNGANTRSTNRSCGIVSMMCCEMRNRGETGLSSLIVELRLDGDHADVIWPMSQLLLVCLIHCVVVFAVGGPNYILARARQL